MKARVKAPRAYLSLSQKERDRISEYVVELARELERTAVKRAAEYYAEIKREIAKEIFEELDKCWIDSNTLPDCARLVDLDKVEEIKRRYIKHDLERDTGEAETDGKR